MGNLYGVEMHGFAKNGFRILNWWLNNQYSEMTDSLMSLFIFFNYILFNSLTLFRLERVGQALCVMRRYIN